MIIPNIILEGIGRIGKTTLAEALINEGYEYFKLEPPTSKANTFYKYVLYFMKINGFSKFRENPFVFDRGHITEQVYGRLYSPFNYEDGVLDHWLNWMEAEVVVNLTKQVEMRPTVIVYIEPKNLQIMEPDGRKGKLDIKIELDMYERILKRTHLPIIRVSTQTDFGWKQTAEVINEIKEQITHV